MKARANASLRLFLVSSALVLFAALAGLLDTPFARAEGHLGAQVNREGPVRVMALPRSLAEDADVWEFELTFDTHTVAIDGDPAGFSVLVDALGKAHKPLSWSGDGSGGHHRRGVLQFAPLPQANGAVELRISGVGGVAMRVFRWERN